MQLKTKILLGVIILATCISHLLFLAQIDYVVYDHDPGHVARPALKGYYQLQDGQIGSFLWGMWSHHEGDPRYPAFVAYVIALFCYLFGLNEVTMRCVTLLFYLILIYYTYQCARELDSEEAGLLSILILTTTPVMVFWSRMLFPTFCGTVFLMAALYYLLRSEHFMDSSNTILFGLFSGLCLLTHRVMFIPLTALWIIALISSFQKKDIMKSMKGLFLAFVPASMVSGIFLTTYFKPYDEWSNFSRYSLTGNTNFSIRGILRFFKEALIHFGYDNVAAIVLLILLALFWKRKRKLQHKLTLFYYFVTLSFYLCMGTWFVLTYNTRHFQIFAPLIAVTLAISLNKVRFLILMKYAIVVIKGALVLSLVLMILPRLGGSAVLSPFRHYYYIPTVGGNGVIWSDRTFARKEELDYFKKEISKGDIAIAGINALFWQNLASLYDRIQLNGIGRAISPEDANLSAGYLMFYCLSSDNREEYLSVRKHYTNHYLYKSLLEIERFVNESIADEIGFNENVAIINTYRHLHLVNSIEKYIANFNFKKARCFKYHFGRMKMYKVIFKCTENLSEIKTPGQRDAWRFLKRVN